MGDRFWEIDNNAKVRASADRCIPNIGYFTRSLTILTHILPDGFEAVALVAKIFEHFGQCVFQVGFRLEAIMENDNRAFYGVVGNILEALFAAEVGVEVGTQHIPHDDVVFLLQVFGLIGSDAAVGRAKQGGICRDMGTSPHVFEVAEQVGRPSAQVVEGVVAYGMAFAYYSLKYFGIFADIVTNAEESGLCVCRFQLVEHPGRYFGNRAVVEGQENDFFGGGDFPGKPGEELLDELGRFYEVHGLSIGVFGLLLNPF